MPGFNDVEKDAPTKKRSDEKTRPRFSLGLPFRPTTPAPAPPLVAAAEPQPIFLNAHQPPAPHQASPPLPTRPPPTPFVHHLLSRHESPSPIPTPTPVPVFLQTTAAAPPPPPPPAAPVVVSFPHHPPPQPAPPQSHHALPLTPAKKFPSYFPVAPVALPLVGPVRNPNPQPPRAPLPTPTTITPTPHPNFVHHGSPGPLVDRPAVNTRHHEPEPLLLQHPLDEFSHLPDPFEEYNEETFAVSEFLGQGKNTK
ncbi:MAG: hypothetical protein GY696_10510, partial [Gammaproteobacteria bacterium]|nr:hypothetical protein [Gammaproteobacteria bacterium]